MSHLPTRICLFFLGALLAGHGCGGTGTATKQDSAAGTGGAQATGGTLASGGTTAAGGATGSGRTTGNPGTGGSNPRTGGAASGGAVSATSSGGTRAGTGGAASGGSVSTGGTRAGTGGTVGTGGATGTTASGGTTGTAIDGGTTECSCAGGQTTWDCLCTITSCSLTLSTFTTDAGAGGNYSTLEEYASCNLVVVRIATSMSGRKYVFDRTTGVLVGRTIESDVLEPCPFGPDGGSYRTLSAGQFPDSTCVRSQCINGALPAISPCPDGGT
jgi:hypothetical protein